MNAVRDNHVEVLALQETTPDFLKRLEEAGISQLLPYSQASSADGYFGNALFSALPFENPSQTDVDSIASYMPGGTVGFDNGRFRCGSSPCTRSRPQRADSRNGAGRSPNSSSSTNTLTPTIF